MIDTENTGHIKLQRFLLLILAAEWLLFVLSGASLSFLYKDPFFSIGVDPLYWIFYGAGMPQFIIGNLWTGIATDAVIFLLLAILIYKPSANRFATALLFLLLLFYITFTGYHTHRNFQTGFIFIVLPFIFRTAKSRRMAYDGVRYFLLFFYTSSALLKLFSPSLFNETHFSQVLMQQYLPYFLENSTGWRTSLNLYLIQHTTIAYLLFIGAFVMEGVTVIGFFTKRSDRLLGILLLCFHFANWVLMDIAPFGQIAFICLLFAQNAFPGNEKD